MVITMGIMSRSSGIMPPVTASLAVEIVGFYKTQKVCGWMGGCNRVLVDITYIFIFYHLLSCGVMTDRDLPNICTCVHWDGSMAEGWGGGGGGGEKEN